MSKSKIQNANKAVVAENKTSGLLKQFFSTESKVGLALLVILLLTVAAIRSKFALIPFERDEGIYGYIGKLILEGKTPYKDFYEQKFPGLFYFYGTMVWLFGDTVKGLHTGFMYLNLLSIILIYFAAERLFSPIAGIISAITFAFVSLTPNLSGFTIQAEHGVAFFIALGIFFYALYSKKGKWYYNLLMGLAFGFAFMTKTSGVFLLLWGGGTLVFGFLFSKEIKLKDLIIQVITYSAGVLLVFGFFLILILMKDSFNEMIYWAYETPKKYVGKIKFEDGIKYYEYTRDAILENHKFFWVHSLLAIGVCLLKPISMKMKFVALSLLFFSCCTIVPGYYFYGHYWIQIIPGLSLIAGLTYYGLITFFKNTLKVNYKGITYIYLGIFLALTMKHINAQKSYYFHPNYERILRTVYGSNPFPESMEIANFINANSKPEDNIAIIGSEPQIYLYTHKKSPSRHAYFAAIVSDVAEHKEWQREFVADIEKAAPRYIVFFNHSISLFVQPNTDQFVFTWLNKYIPERYKLVGVADMVDGMQTNYVYKEALATYQPKGQNIIYIYEKNTVTPVVP
jgi:hypothetical protein